MAALSCQMITMLQGYATVLDDAIIEGTSLPPPHQSTGRITSPHQSLPNHWKYIINGVYGFQICFPYLTHSAIWKEWGFTDTKYNSIINSSNIHNLLKASPLPSQMGLIHYKAHQTDPSTVNKGNNCTNMGGYQAALPSLTTQPYYITQPTT